MERLGRPVVSHGAGAQERGGHLPLLPAGGVAPLAAVRDAGADPSREAGDAHQHAAGLQRRDLPGTWASSTPRGCPRTPRPWRKASSAIASTSARPTRSCRSAWPSSATSWTTSRGWTRASSSSTSTPRTRAATCCGAASTSTRPTTPRLIRRCGTGCATSTWPWTAPWARPWTRWGTETLVMVVSDHGFAPFYRSVHVNAWLRDRGLPGAAGRASNPATTELLAGIDWNRTRAYAIGINGLYLNLRGREQRGHRRPRRRAARRCCRSWWRSWRRPSIRSRPGHPIRHAYRADQVYAETWRRPRPRPDPGLRAGLARQQRVGPGRGAGGDVRRQPA